MTQTLSRPLIWGIARREIVRRTGRHGRKLRSQTSRNAWDRRGGVTVATPSGSKS